MVFFQRQDHALFTGYPPLPSASSPGKRTVQTEQAILAAAAEDVAHERSATEVDGKMSKFWSLGARVKTPVGSAELAFSKGAVIDYEECSKELEKRMEELSMMYGKKMRTLLKRAEYNDLLLKRQREKDNKTRRETYRLSCPSLWHACPSPEGWRDLQGPSIKSEIPTKEPESDQSEESDFSEPELQISGASSDEDE